MNLEAQNLFSLKGKTALLTGASGYLGRTLAEVLLQNGATLHALGRSEELEKRAQGWNDKYGEGSATVHRIDMYDRELLGTTLDKIIERGPVHVLVNNAHELGANTGFNVPNGGLEGMTWDHWLRNLTGGIYWAALATQKVGEGMKAAGGGSIINIATMYALVAPSPLLYEDTAFMNPPGYSTSKAGLMAFTRYVASFWGPHNIRANSILPGPFPNTETASENAVRTGNDDFLQKLNNRTCLRRTGKAHELAGALLYLASDASSFVTGHGLVVDGGWTAI